MVVADCPLRISVDNDQDYITLQEAAKIAGYSSFSTLYAAARNGRLKVRRFGVRTVMTTRPWLAEYQAALKASMAHRRGQPRDGDTPEDDGSNNH